MLNFIATPDRITDAIDRDLDDAERIEHLLSIVTNALDAVIADIPDFKHPDIRYQPVDLMDALLDAAKSLRWEQQRVSRGPVVLGDA